jgi:hypothetical protein
VGRLIFFTFRFRRGLSSPPLYSIHAAEDRQGERVFLFSRRFSFATGFFRRPYTLSTLARSGKGFFRPDDFVFSSCLLTKGIKITR